MCASQQTHEGSTSALKNGDRDMAGSFLTISILNRRLVPLLVGLPVLLRTFVVTGLTVTLLTYGIMPRLTQLFRKWLHST